MTNVVQDADTLTAALIPSESTTGLLRELVSHLREKRTELREDWARRITESGLLTAMTREEIFAGGGQPSRPLFRGFFSMVFT